uniref:Uncharacterized protein n=1 Tax=Glossina brevipalpis TaxID=37001 RepID=A0A1A9W3C1_9MUSC
MFYAYIRGGYALLVVVLVVMLFFSMASNKIHAQMCHIFKKPPAYISAFRLHLALIINVYKVGKVSHSAFGFLVIFLLDKTERTNIPAAILQRHLRNESKSTTFGFISSMK